MQDAAVFEAAAEMVETPLRQDGHQTQESFCPPPSFSFFSVSLFRCLNVVVSIQGCNPPLPALNLPRLDQSRRVKPA